MADLFRTVLDMSLTGSYVILTVILVRLLLKKAPKKYSLALWGAAAFRLCCPVSFESVLSLFRLPVFHMEAIQTSHTAQTSSLNYIPEVPNSAPISTGIFAVNSYFQDTTPQIPVTSTVAPTPTPEIDWLTIAAGVWCVGMAVMVLYSLMSYVVLRRRVSAAIPMEGNVFRCETADSPFILGFFRPKIYLPAGLDGSDREYVLAHERTHLKNRDHLIKLFAYALLVLHWFNPLCHIAFRLMSKDMEMRCDEAVLARSPDIRKPYSTTLVSLAVEPGAPLPSPLAFGEAGVKSRVKNILRWKKPALWVTIAATVLSTLCLVACAANPVQDETAPSGLSIFGKEYRPYDLTYISGAYGFVGYCLTGYQPRYQITEDGELYRLIVMTDNQEWSLLGDMEEIELTEDNFDTYFHFNTSTLTGVSTFDAASLRSQVKQAWVVEFSPADPDLQTNTQFCYVLQTQQDQVYVAAGSYHPGDPSNGSVTSLVWLLPAAGEGTAPAMDEGSYVSSHHLYQSLVYSTFMNDDSGAVYTIEDGMFTISLRKTGTMLESFIISDRDWEDFPFTEEECEDLLPLSGASFYQQYQAAQYLDVSSHCFLLRTDSDLYLCHYSSTPTGRLSMDNIYLLTPLGSEDDTWMIQFQAIGEAIRTVASAADTLETCIQTCPTEYNTLVLYSDEYMVLRYCFDRFMSRSETGMEASVMAQVCRDILISNGEEALADHSTENGQEWFETFWDQILDAEDGWNSFGGNVLLNAIANHNAK